jgi:hypothetical protein
VAKLYEEIEPKLAEWITRQRLFFVATAPSDAGHVNCSPKGPIGTFRVLGPREVAYLDVIGSGAETIAHLRENGRIVIMFCAFEGSPRIVRLHGRGDVLPHDAIEFPEAEPVPQSRRSIIRVAVDRVADSCGYGVPLMDYAGERDNQRRWAEGKLAKGGPGALEAYVAEKNARSIDGLPAIQPG